MSGKDWGYEGDEANGQDWTSLLLHYLQCEVIGKHTDCSLLQQAYVLLSKLRVITIREGLTSNVVVIDFPGEQTGTPGVPQHSLVFLWIFCEFLQNCSWNAKVGS